VTLVLDSSISLAWCFHDEQTPEINSILLSAASQGAHAPILWRFEVANGLVVAQRRKRIQADLRKLLLARLMSLDLELDADGDGRIWSTTVELADLYGLTVYDAAYLELAQRRRVPLATLDAALARAAKAAGVETLI
jgi:predicted nucleic acid-binding protein